MSAYGIFERFISRFSETWQNMIIQVSINKIGELKTSVCWIFITQVYFKEKKDLLVVIFYEKRLQISTLILFRKSTHNFLVNRPDENSNNNYISQT